MARYSIRKEKRNKKEEKKKKREEKGKGKGEKKNYSTQAHLAYKYKAIPTRKLQTLMLYRETSFFQKTLAKNNKKIAPHTQDAQPTDSASSTCKRFIQEQPRASNQESVHACWTDVMKTRFPFLTMP